MSLPLDLTNAIFSYTSILVPSQRSVLVQEQKYLLNTNNSPDQNILVQQTDRRMNYGRYMCPTIKKYKWIYLVCIRYNGERRYFSTLPIDDPKYIETHDFSLMYFVLLTNIFTFLPFVSRARNCILGFYSKVSDSF